MAFALLNTDCLQAISTIPTSSVHLIVTDPPYFIDSMGDDWKRERIADHRTTRQTVGSLPAGMKFDPQQGRNFQAFMADFSKEMARILKPGGFYVCFSQARLYHRLGVAVEDAGFEVRDMLGWTYEGQAKAFSQDHFVRKMKLREEEKQIILTSLGGRKTPQLKPMIEPMVLAQKPRDGTFVENWMRHETGLVDTTTSLDGKFPGQLMNVPKPSTAERGEGNDHPTVKPVTLIEHLIALFSKPGQIVVDPFLGSGSHGIAAARSGRHFIGIERDRHYFEIAASRLQRFAVKPWSPSWIGSPAENHQALVTNMPISLPLSSRSQVALPVALHLA